jgi:hypothetical protein
MIQVQSLCLNALLVNYKDQNSILIGDNSVESLFTWLNLSRFELISIENAITSNFPNHKIKLLNLSYRKPSWIKNETRNNT